jgi:hypothetical protein
MTDDRFDERLRQAAQDYHRPPATPREELWHRIAAARAARKRQVIVVRSTLRWGVGIAAVLALGVAIGRWSATGSPTRSGSAGTGERTSTFVYQLAAAQYLSRTEALLTGFRAEIHGGAPTAQFSVQARDLLCTTRLMLDSPAARDVRLKNLLEDLELVLAQIAQLRSSGDREDVQSINQGLDQRSVLLRLRTANPAGPGPVRTQGAL